MQLARGGTVGNREDVRWCYRGTTLAWDHVEYFRRRREPAAILVHVFEDRARITLGRSGAAA
jgi:hypothetical protein